MQFLDLGWIHLPHLRIRKYFTENSSVNFHDKVFLHFFLKFRKKWRKNLSWKFMEELPVSVKYLWIRKWTWWIRPKYRKYLDEKADMCPNSMLSHNFFMSFDDLYQSLYFVAVVILWTKLVKKQYVWFHAFGLPFL